jgi:hypothetical protein
LSDDLFFGKQVGHAQTIGFFFSLELGDGKLGLWRLISSEKTYIVL